MFSRLTNLESMLIDFFASLKSVSKQSAYINLFVSREERKETITVVSTQSRIWWSRAQYNSWSSAIFRACAKDDQLHVPHA